MDRTEHQLSEIWAAVDRRRSAVVEYLETLPPGDWDTQSPCPAWTLRDVAAHLTLAGLPRHRLLYLFLRYPGTVNRTIRDGSRARARELTNEQIIRALRELIGRHQPLPGLTCREALVDIIGHTQDLTLPLGREIAVPPAEIGEATDHVLGYGGKGNAKVFRALPAEGLRLVADDHDWASGSGPEVTGSMRDLFLVTIGRTVHLDRLTGDGAELLRTRIAAGG